MRLQGVRKAAGKIFFSCSVVLLAALGVSAESTEIALVDGPQGAAFEVRGLPRNPRGIGNDQTRAALRIFVDSAEGAPAVSGSYQIGPDTIRFTPRFPLQPGVGYRVEFRASLLFGGSAENEPLTRTFDIPRKTAGVPARVVGIFPSAEHVPENLLKFYVHFSAPMSRGGVYQHIRLEQASGQPVDLAFLEIAEELWDPEYRRLTLLFDPGRIKRELLPNKEVGTALEEGGQYRLVISQEWIDAEGEQLSTGAIKEFTVGPPDRTPPETSNWTIVAPRVATRGKLEVDFPEPMDRALLERLPVVVNRRGQPVPGEVRVENHEKRWTFTPTREWDDYRYEILVPTILEDLAGNTIGRPFEVDVFERIEDRINQTQVRLSVTLLRD